MNRSISIHPWSVLAGVAFALIVLVAMGQSVVGTPTRVEYLPHPHDLLKVAQGSPLTVPPGKVFVLTALGTDVIDNQTYGTISFTVDGQAEGVTYSGPGNWPEGLMSIASVASGRSVPAGAVIEVSASNSGLVARAWGYFAPVGLSTPGTQNALRLPYHPHPRDMIQISEGSPLTVPSGRMLVVTALGGATGDNDSLRPQHAIRINGQTEATTRAHSSHTKSPLSELPVGLTAPPGAVVEPVQTGGVSPSPGRAWGYLVNL